IRKCPDVRMSSVSPPFPPAVLDALFIEDKFDFSLLVVSVSNWCVVWYTEART
ncbi:hypothetical protein P692DRAFT_20755156, partial [Suillus brevipes Sb2]